MQNIKALSLVLLSGLFITASQVYAGPSSCLQIRDGDKRTFCMAKSTNQASRCGAIQNVDNRKMCFAIVLKQKSRCGSIKDQSKRAECFVIVSK